MPKVAFRTLGCRLNQADTDKMAEDLLSHGFTVVPESESPDVVIVNTCTVTQEATRASRKSAKSAASTNPGSLVVVAGCYAVAEREDAESIEGIGMVVGNDDKDTIGRLVSQRLGIASPPLLQIGKRPAPINGASPGIQRTRVNLRVQTGCDEYCTFCIIPRTRGSLRSYPLEDLLNEARRKVAEGARELVLTGVHLGKYGWDQGRPDEELVRLLEGLLAIEGLARLRLSSILSRHLTPRVVTLIGREQRVCRHLHVPLQSGSDPVLERMNRPYRIGEYLETIERVKEAIPGVGLTTDVIVGFPGESLEDFGRTIDVVESVRYCKLHVFRYSPRQGTPSAEWGDQISETEKRRRSKELIGVGSRIRREFHESQLEMAREVLVEEALADGRLVGHTDDFMKVIFPGPHSLVEKLARVRIASAGSDSVEGQLLEGVPWELADPRFAKLMSPPLLSSI